MFNIGEQAQYHPRWLPHTVDYRCLNKGRAGVQLFSVLAVLLATASVLFIMPVAVIYWDTGLVSRLSTAVLAAELMLLSFLSFACGLILDTVTAGGGK